MTRHDPDGKTLAFEYELDAPPARVWRAITVPEFVERWLLPAEAEDSQAEGPRVRLDVVEAEDGKFIRYNWCETNAPVPDSTVTFEVTPNDAGGTTFRILHEMACVQPRAANSNIPKNVMTMCLAA